MVRVPDKHLVDASLLLGSVSSNPAERLLSKEVWFARDCARQVARLGVRKVAEEWDDKGRRVQRYVQYSRTLQVSARALGIADVVPGEGRSVGFFASYLSPSGWLGGARKALYGHLGPLWGAGVVIGSREGHVEHMIGDVPASIERVVSLHKLRMEPDEMAHREQTQEIIRLALLAVKAHEARSPYEIVPPVPIARPGWQR